MKTLQAFQKAIEPIVEVVLALEKRIDNLPVPKDGKDGVDGKSVTLDEVVEVLVLNHSAVLKGADGANGENGRDGQDGARGADGKDGADADPESVAKVLAVQYPDVFRGSDGRDGAPGCDGRDGAGIESKAFVAGQVYREGTVVTANIGQYFRALRDTVDPTDTADSWERIGTGGFRHRGTFEKDATYVEGDIYRKDFGSFVIVNGKPELLAGRGSKGEAGPVGASGAPGRDGRDGSTVIAAEVKGCAASISFQDADGNIDSITLDFTAGFEEVVRRMMGELHGA